MLFAVNAPLWEHGNAGGTQMTQMNADGFVALAAASLRAAKGILEG